MNTPRILALTGTPHPQALVTGIDPAHGILGFRWLNAEGTPVDSGGSVARFTPLEADEDGVYLEVTDATLIDAIENPAAVVAAVPVAVTRRQLFLWLNASAVTRAQIRGLIQNDEAALIEFDEAQEFRRDHPLVTQLGTALGLTGAQIDTGFRAAALL